MRLRQQFAFSALIFGLVACQGGNSKNNSIEQKKIDSLENVKRIQEEEAEKERQRPKTAADIKLTKELSYDKYTLDDQYEYEDTVRVFQLDKIKEKLAFIENFQRETATYAVLQNHKNKNGEAPLVKNYHRNAYTRISDSLETERYQSAPLYVVGETEQPTLYGPDGSLVKLLSSDTIPMVKIAGVSFEGTWEVPKRYVKTIGDTVTFHRVAFVDVTNQNILTAERKGDADWVIRSMNKATTGVHKPPYAHETPTGMFVVQEKKSKMYYLKDGTSTIAGYAPYASRFTNGAYIHGIPTNSPNAPIIETSWSLGTIPRSHMCVRNASSHSKFVYDWAKRFNALVVVID